MSWALLGLVIQRPSYGYELVQRFERTYSETLELSSPSQIYTALDTLVRRRLIEIVPIQELQAGGGRQPKPHYRATVDGARGYEQWLVCQLAQQRRRSRLFAQQLGMLAPQAALRVLEHCERACLKEASAAAGSAPPGPVPPGTASLGTTPLGSAPQSSTPQSTAPPGTGGLTEQLAAEEDRLAIRAKLDWIEYARRAVRALASERGPQ